MTWDVPIIFMIIFALSLAETCFTIDAFVILQRRHEWWSGTEKARMGFLIFSCLRTIVLSATYAAAHFKYKKRLLDTMHIVFVVVSTILWIISGGIIYQMWTYVECANEGIPDNTQELKSQLAGGLSLCHEIKTIEIIAWCIAAVSIIAAIPLTMTYIKDKKSKQDSARGNNGHA